MKFFIYNSDEIMEICYKIKPSGNPIGGEYELIKNGIETNPKTELVDNEKDADYVIYHGRNAWGWSSKYVSESLIKNPDKAIIIDYHDSPNYILPDNAKYYFKRSTLQRDGCKFKTPKYSREIYTINYCVRPDFLEYVSNKGIIKKDIDIGVFFDPNNKHIVNYNRSKVTKFIRDSKRLDKYKKHIGLIKPEDKEYRNEPNYDYIDMMLRCKIIVTCNPSQWYGDYRLYEALISGAIVFVDRMPSAFGKSYDLDDLTSLSKSIDFYLKTPYLLNDAIETSIKDVYNNGLTKNLIDRILKVIDK